MQVLVQVEIDELRDLWLDSHFSRIHTDVEESKLRMELYLFDAQLFRFESNIFHLAHNAQLGVLLLDTLF